MSPLLLLGMAYYYADHLLVCKNGRTTFVVYTLWLIAQEPSLLTRRHRIEGPYQDAALFVLGDLLIQSPTHQRSAWEYFELLETLPYQPAHHLALIGGLWWR